MVESSDKFPYLEGMKGCPPLSPVQLRTALSLLKGRFKWRNRALLVLGVRSGMRISELLSLQIDQVWDGTAPRSRIYLPRQDSKGKRTGASIILHPLAAKAVAKWISMWGSIQQEDYLFPSQLRPTQPLGKHAAWLILHNAFLAAGVDGIAGTHCMRKTFARNVHEALRGDLFRLAKAMRHTSPLTTLSYLSFRQEEIDRAILRA